MTNKRPWYSWILLILIISAVTWFILHNFNEITRYNFRIKWPYLILAFLFVNAAYLVTVFIWTRLAMSFGLNVPILSAGKAWFVSQLGKYVPGKVTLLLVRLDAYRGYSKRKITVATGIEYIAMLASAFVLSLVALASAFQIVPYYIRWFAGVGTVLFLFLLWPPLSLHFINLILKFLKREQIEEFPPYGLLLRFVGAYILAGLLQGMGLYFILNSLLPVDFRYFLIITGAYEVAGLIGIAAVFAPSGIGVREGVLFLVLPAFIPMPAVIIGTIVMRLIVTFTELFLAFVFSVAEKIYIR
jgi:glycosyltransferase 2 family protein